MTSLYQYRDIKKEIAHLEERLQLFELKRTSPRQSIISDMPASPSYRHDKMDNDLIKLEELELKYKGLLEQLYTQQAEIEDMIETLEPVERELIRYRYFDGLSWVQIQQTMFLTQRTSFRVHKRALEKLQKMEK